jgi:hypothetical protein
VQHRLLAVILLLKGSRLLTGVLIAVIVSTVMVGVFDLSATAGVAVLGSLPSGLPGFAIQLIDLADLEAVIVGGFAVALVSFADTSVRRASTPHAPASRAIPIRRWSVSALRTSPPVSSRASRSAAAPRARPSQRRLARAPSSPAWSAP